MSIHRTTLSAESILSHLSSEHYTVKVEAELPSTNLVLKNEAILGALHGTVLIADSQTAGRGRLGRTFFSPHGSGIYMSVLLRPDLPLALAAGRITTLSALAVCRAIRKTTNLHPSIKWVNDLLLNGKKVCGILAEAVSLENSYAVILGIGINVKKTAFPTELSDIATSLEENGTPPEREVLIAAILDELAKLDLSFPENDLKEYIALSAVLGKTVRILPREGEPYTALAVDITKDGALTVEKEGKRFYIASGEVSLRLAPLPLSEKETRK